MRFPNELVGPLCGISFKEAFETLPNIIEFVDKLWIEEKTTGIFKEFLHFVKAALTNPGKLSAHQDRCRKFVRDLKTKRIPPYLQKYT